MLHALALQHPETPAVILHALGTSASHKLTKNNNSNNKIQCVHIFSVLAHVSLSFIKAGTSREATSLLFSLKNFQKDILLTAVGELLPQMNTTDILVQSSNGTTRITCQVCSKLMIKTPESRISPIVLVFSLLTLNK